jgi:hypothetical protein
VGLDRRRRCSASDRLLDRGRLEQQRYNRKQRFFVNDNEQRARKDRPADNDRLGLSCGAAIDAGTIDHTAAQRYAVTRKLFPQNITRRRDSAG